MTSLFLFSLIVGGGLLGFSLLGNLLGAGDVDFDSDIDADFDVDFDTDFDTDFDADFDVDVDTDFDADVDTDFDADVDTDLGTDAVVHGEVTTDLAGAIRIFTIRNLTYFLFGFGGVGWLGVTIRPDLPIWLVSLLAVAGGLIAGSAAAVIFGWVKATDSGWQADETSFVGCQGRVILPVGHGKVGQIIVLRGHREHELRALPFDHRAEAPESWRNVVVIEMEGGTARVSPLDLLGPAEEGPSDS